MRESRRTVRSTATRRFIRTSVKQRASIGSRGGPAHELAFEIERFEWTGDDRLEVTGRWFGVRGQRFMRPTLHVRVGDRRRRMIALLDHKPWPADGEGPWIAAFSWRGPPDGVTAARLEVAPDVVIDLPAPGADAAGATPESPPTPDARSRAARPPHRDRSRRHRARRAAARGRPGAAPQRAAREAPPAGGAARGTARPPAVVAEAAPAADAPPAGGGARRRRSGRRRSARRAAPPSPAAELAAARARAAPRRGARGQRAARGRARRSSAADRRALRASRGSRRARA